MNRIFKLLSSLQILSVFVKGLPLLLLMVNEAHSQGSPTVMRVSGTNCVGALQRFTLTASGCSSITWTVNGGGVAQSPISGNNYIEVIWNTTSSNASVTASYSNCNGGMWGSSSSTPLSLQPGVTPSVSLSNNNPKVCAGGGNVTFTANPVNGGSTPNYQWRINGSPVLNNTNRITTLNVQPGDRVTVAMGSSANCASPSVVNSTNFVDVGLNNGSFGSVGVVSGGGTYCPVTQPEGMQVVVSGGTVGRIYSIYRNGTFLTSKEPESGGSQAGMVFFGPYTDGNFNVYVRDNCNVNILVGNSTITPITPSTPEGSVNITPALKSSYCKSDPGLLTITAGAGSNYQWFIDGNPYSTSSVLNYPFTHPDYGETGSHSVSVQYNPAGSGCHSSQSVTIGDIQVVIAPELNPNVVISNPSNSSNICVGSTVDFQANISGYTLQPTVTWNINGQIFNGTSVTGYNANEVGTITATVTMISNDECISGSGTISRQVSVNVVDGNFSGMGTVGGGGSYCPVSSPEGLQVVVQGAARQDKIYSIYKGVTEYGTATPDANGMIRFGPFTEGTFHVYVSDDCGVSQLVGTSTITPQVPTTPEGSVNINPALKSAYCDLDPGTLSITAGAGSNYQWFIDDYPFSTGSTLNYPFDHEIYGEPGSHSISVQYTPSVGGCSSSDQVTVGGIPVVITSAYIPAATITSPASSSTICIGSVVNFEADISGYAVPPTVSWDIDGEVFNGASVPGYAIEEVGSITATLTMISNDECIAGPGTVTRQVSINVIDGSFSGMGTVGGGGSYCPVSSPEGLQVVVQGAARQDKIYSIYKGTTEYGTATPDANGMIFFGPFTEGTFHVYVNDDCGVSQLVGTSVISPQEETLPEASISLSRPLKFPFCSLETEQLVFTAGSGSGYQWYVDGEPFGTGSSLAYPFGHEIYGVPGDHSVTVSYVVSGGCSITEEASAGPVPVQIAAPNEPDIRIDAPENSTLHCIGSTVNFEAIASGYTLEPSITWNINGETFSGANVTNYLVDETTISATVTMTSNDDCIIGSQAIADGISIKGYISLPSPSLAVSSIKCMPGVLNLSVDNNYTSYEWIVDGDVSEETTHALPLTLNDLYVPIQIQVKGISNSCESDYLTFEAFARDHCENYVRKELVKIPGVTDESSLDESSPEWKSDDWTYYDGLGRPNQKISQQGSPLENDIVQHIDYDDFGRESTKYLPYTSSSQNGYFQYDAEEQSSWFYHSNNSDPLTSGIARDLNPVTKLIFDHSSLNRVLQQTGPGEEWRGMDGSESDKGVRYVFGDNEPNTVALWEADESGVLRIKSDQTWYDPSELYKTTTTDEEGNKVIEYTDKQGQTLLKKVQVAENPSETSHEGWACTYYVYDDFNQLRYVLPPQLIEEIRGNITSGYSPSTALLDQYAFQYKYDHRKRMTEKKVPGAEPVYMVYDNRDRLVLTQDANQRSTEFGNSSGREWTFTKYDALNRPIIMGIYTHGSVVNQSEMQTHVNSQIASGNDFYEERNGAVSTHKYTNRTFPISNTEILTVTYYDNYGFLDNGRFESGGPVFSYKNDVATTIPYPATSNQQVKGQVTGSKVKVLDPQDGTKFLNTVTYYDDRYRVIQTITESNLGGREIMTNCYDDLTQNVKESVTTSEEPDPLTVRRTYSYDHAQRLLEIQHQLNEEDPVTIVSNRYNELGELIGKDLNKTDESTSWQTVDYRYNIRGWLTHINDANLTDANDLFGMELYYTDGFEVPYYNGNISGVKWKTAVDEDRMAYGYRYDKLNRITNAHYVRGEKRPDDTFEHAGHYNLEILPQGGNPSGYDLNGNILNLKRYGLSDLNPAAIDVLTYHYDGNQLTQVDDAGTQEGFKDGTNEGHDYEYDANGNMTIDRNKGIENITYNFLNLPMIIEMTEGRKIEYIYDAAGIKLSQRVYEDDAQPATKTTDYIGERVYETKVGEDIKLQFLHHEEGRIVKGPEPGDPNWTPEAKEWEYQYNLKDHLGNTRLTFGEGKTMEYLLTMEIDPIENRILEAEDFENVFESEDNKLPQLNHTPVSASTPNPEYVIFLNGTERMMGPAKSLKVLPGDQVAIEAYAKYLHLESYNSSVAGNMLLSGFLGTFLNAGSDFLISNGYVDEGLLAGLENLANGGSDYDGVPQAYLNYILFDREYNVIEGKKLQISEAGKFEIGDTNLGLHEHLQIDPITIAKEGYIYIYLSNQTPGSEVYFDDLTITHTQGRVVRKDDYYPFGLTFNSSKREGSLSNKFTFQGQEKQEETGWYSFKWRNHDPAIGRFFNVDPLASSYVHNSPYAFSENKVTVHVELEGLESVYVFDQKNQPSSRGDYTAQIFVVHPNGKVGGPYLGSSYPNNSNKHNTLNQGTHLYNNKAGHKISSKKGLNIVDGEGNRQNTPGTDPNGNPTTMEWVNVHEGDSDSNRGSAGCPTCHPAHAEEFLNNFDWSGEITVVDGNGDKQTYKGTTGKSSGTFTVFRGESEESNMMMDLILYLLNEGGDLSQKQAQSDNTRVVNDKEKLFE